MFSHFILLIHTSNNFNNNNNLIIIISIHSNKTFVSDYGVGDSYGSPLPPEVLEHNPKLKFYPEANIKTYDSSQTDFQEYAAPLKPVAHHHHHSGKKMSKTSNVYQRL